jgi:DNA-binding TFAR19-related protein (PDSD5 family)
MDEELEMLKRRKLIELKKMMAAKKSEETVKAKEPTSREVLNNYFHGRAWEVYKAATSQYPKIMLKVEKILVEAIKEGKIKERIDGESLYLFLRRLGLPVRLQTTIRYEEHGELKTISEKIKEDN